MTTSRSATAQTTAPALHHRDPEAPSPFPSSAPSDPGAPHVERARVEVDAGSDAGELRPIWRSVGYDEINWTYTPTGRQLLGAFASTGDDGDGAPHGDAQRTAFHIRPHYVFCSGTAFGIPHWGSGNVYHEDGDGNPSYDFTVVDQTYDAIVGAGHHVLVELGFTPRDLLPPEAAELTVVDSPTVYSAYEAGQWAYPPRDLGRWGDLVAALVTHCAERYGEAEVRTWLWELWNEPDITYWRGSVEEFCALYDTTAAAVRGALPDAVVGGPAVTGGGVDFLRAFLTHTARVGTPLDFVSFHTKGSAFTPWRVYGPTGGPAPELQSPSAHKMLFEVRRLLRVVAEFEEYRGLPAIVDECDAGVPAHFSAYDNANYAFQNTEYYPVFQVKLMKRLLDLDATEAVRVHQATAWAFYFEGERCFEGTRAFLTAGGVEKPLLNAYRALARLGARRVPATSDSAADPALLDAGDGRAMPEEVDVLASADDASGPGAARRVALLVWRHTDDSHQRAAAATLVEVVVSGLADGAWRVSHHRIDAQTSNAHTRWVEQGSPPFPTAEQLSAITARQGLEEAEPPRAVTSRDGVVELVTELPLPSASLFVLERA